MQQEEEQRTMSHVPRRAAENLKPPRESDGARTARKRLNRSSVEVRRAQTSSEPVSYTQAAEAMTNNDNDNEPRRTAYLIMKPARESDGAPTPRKKLNGSSRSAIYANRAASPSRTHTPIKSFKQINGRQRQAQNARAEHMKRACDGSPRESDQGLTTSMPWPCSGHACAAQAPVRPKGQDTARKRCCSNQINSNSLILCRASRRERCSVSASTACPSPSASARQHQPSATAASIRLSGIIAPKCAGIGQRFLVIMMQEPYH